MNVDNDQGSQIPKPTTRGDPGGRRLARRRSQILAEAGRACEALRVLLLRAGIDWPLCRELQARITQEEQAELMRAYGHVESRRRFKARSGHPLHENRRLALLFIDESGMSVPDCRGVDSFFALGAVAMFEEDVATYKRRADAIKSRFFGTTNITFHEPYMRNFEGPYYFSGDERKQREFDEALNDLVLRTRFVAFGVGVRKAAFARDFIAARIDPYLPLDIYALAIMLLLERVVDYLASAVEPLMGRVTFESQGAREDVEHQWGYATILRDGTQWIPQSAFRNFLEAGLRFTPKQGADAMELADMLSRVLWEWVRDGCQGSPRRWEIFSSKIYARGDKRMGKFGVKVFPDSDIRERIKAHRAHCGRQREN